MAGSYKTIAQLFTDADAPFATGAQPENQDFQDLGASFQHLGTRLSLATSEQTLVSDTYFTDDGASLYVIDPGGAARNFDPDPAGTFVPGQVVAVVNAADADETITFDSGGIAQAITQDGAAIFCLTSAGWRCLAAT